MPNFYGYRLNVGASYGRADLLDKVETETEQQARDYFWKHYAFDDDEELYLRDEDEESREGTP